MSYLSSFLIPETRDNSGHPRDPEVASWWGGNTNTASGFSITPESALRMSAVWACITVLSETMASISLHLMRTDGDKKQKAIKHPLYNKLHTQPNRWQTSYEFRQMLTAHRALRGNAYAEIFRDGAGNISELVPLHPDHVWPFLTPAGQIAYDFTPTDAPPRIILADEMHHWRGMCADGLRGLSPVQEQREALGLAKGAEDYGARFFANDASPTKGFLKMETHFKDEDSRKNFINRWHEWQSGANRHRTPILEDGMNYEAVGLTNADAQFLESRKFSVNDIARIWRIPPHMIGDLERSTNNNIEHQGIEFVVHTIRPLAVSHEQAMDRDMILPNNRGKIFTKYNLNALMRGDSKTRGEFYTKMFNVGAYSRNDIRRLEDENPTDDGDEYFVPANMKPVSQIGKEDQESEANTVSRWLEPILNNALQRINSAEKKALQRAVKSCSTPSDIEKRISEFYSRFQVLAERILKPIQDAADWFDMAELIQRHKSQSLTLIHAAITSDEPEQKLKALDIWFDQRAETEVITELAILGKYNGNRAQNIPD